MISYDVVDDRRRERVYKALRGMGERVQFSVFVCDFSPTERANMTVRLDPLIDHATDQILAVDLGPMTSARERIDSLGRGYEYPERHVFVV